MSPSDTTTLKASLRIATLSFLHVTEEAAKEKKKKKNLTPPNLPQKGAELSPHKHDNWICFIRLCNYKEDTNNWSLTYL